MPGIELHADFDRDGRLSESALERSARLDWPGAIVVANLDADRRSLPARPASGDTPEADYDIATAYSRDDDQLPLRIRVAPGALGAGERLRIRCSGVMHTRVRLSTTDGRIVPHRLGAPQDYELPDPPRSGVLELWLQVRTIAGATFGVLSGLDLRYRPDEREESRFELSLMRVDAAGQASEEDTGRFTVAPVILDDHAGTALRVYMINAGYNWPSFHDMQAATAEARVPLVDVDVRLSDGDLWLQDQYQHASMQGARQFQQIVLHLPRLRHNNTIDSITNNLEDLVNSHFRSRDIGLYRDLWDRVIVVNTCDGGVLRVSFREIRDWAYGAMRAANVADRLDTYGMLTGQPWTRRATGDFVTTVRDMSRNLRRLQDAIAAAIPHASTERADLLQRIGEAAAQMVRAASTDYAVTGSGDAARFESTLGGRRVCLSADTARRLQARGDQMHRSANYGGNIESTPPVPGAPLGKIIIGNAPDPENGGDFVDPDLLRLLAKQKKQPIVEIDTTWLKVGHVDEVMAVVPHARSGFSILHASSAAAMAILREAEALYRSGLPVDHPDTSPGPRRPSGVLSRLMNEGSHPVTRLFRGKSWRHIHTAAASGGVADIVEPPDIYLQLVYQFGGGEGINVHGIGLVPGEGPMRRYPADISPSEVIYCERDREGISVNDTVDASVLAASRTVLADEIGVPLLSIPVLFDRVRSTEDFREQPSWNRTTAFTPDMVNMQVINGHLMVPKPYGPRMRRDDAIAVVRTAMEAVGMPTSIRDRVGPRLVARRQMTRETYWVEKVPPAYLMTSSGIIRDSYGGMQNERDVIRAFKDSFPGADEAEMQRRLIRPNRRWFTSSGQLREDFSRIVVDDGMVDLFELWAAAVVEQTGAVLHFVDTWAYHLGDGQIHCGTNVVRRPRRAGRVDAWDAPDHEFRAGVMVFEPEEVVS